VNRTVKHLAFFLAIVVFGAGALAATLAFAVPATRAITFGTTSSGALTPVLQDLEQRSVILDRHGKTMATLYATEDRAPVFLKDVSPGVISAVVSIEDRTFYSHRGIDPKSILRALFKDVNSGVVAQGGSTITQQLVKNTLIENPKRDLRRKIREAALAMRLEEIYTKDEILERYLNTVYFGRDAYGIRAASERYFNTQPIHLSVPQAAMLAGMISAPSAYDPVLHPAAARARRHTVLLAMRETGIISSKAVAAYDRYPLPKRAYSDVATIAPTSYFVSEVVQRLLADERLGPNLPTRRNLIYHGGLRVTTTYDPDLQLLAERAVRDTIAAAAKQPNIPVTGALVSIDNSNGAVRAMVSGTGDSAGEGFKNQQFNYATGSNRQVGSAMKVFTLATALKRGYGPNDTIDGGRCTIPGSLTTDGKPYSPGGETEGVISLRTAITNSINCAFVRLEVGLGGKPDKLGEQGYERAARGPQLVIDTAREMGVRSPNLLPVTSLTLGTRGISPLDMASAYSTLANDGVHRPAIFVTKVVGPDGKVVFQEPLSGHHPKQMLPVNIARTETQMLLGPVKSGTAARTLADFGRPAAGKTGTTDENIDAWFVGFTPQMTTAVWMGDPKDERTSMNPFFGQDVFGGTIPARIWRAFMEGALAGQPVLNFNPPDESFWPASRYISLTGRATSPPPTIPTTTTTTIPETTTTTKPKKPKKPTTTTTAPATTTTKPGGP
jgi:penicillin-binding protein 1A